jgi:hypothetical protein
VNETRRNLLQSIFAAPALAAVPVSPPTVVENSPGTRTLLVFKLKQPAPQSLIETLKTDIRSKLDAQGFSDIKAILLPEYLDVGVLSLPHQGEEACSG